MELARRRLAHAWVAQIYHQVGFSQRGVDLVRRNEAMERDGFRETKPANQLLHFLLPFHRSENVEAEPVALGEGGESAKKKRQLAIRPEESENRDAVELGARSLSF